jgi:hypothetical protein
VPGFAATSLRVIEFKFAMSCPVMDTEASLRPVPVAFRQTTILSGVVEFGTVKDLPLSIFKTVRDICSIIGKK